MSDLSISTIEELTFECAKRETMQGKPKGLMSQRALLAQALIVSDVKAPWNTKVIV